MVGIKGMCGTVKADEAQKMRRDQIIEGLHFIKEFGLSTLCIMVRQ